MIRDEFKAVFLGKHTFWAGFVRVEGNSVYAKTPRKLFPMFTKWQLVLSNVKQYLEQYDEFKLITLNDGRTDEVVRVFHIDMDTFEGNQVRMQPHILRELQSLRAENNFLLQQNKEYEELIKVQGNMDAVKRKMKDDYSFHTGLKPDYMYNKSDDKKK